MTWENAKRVDRKSANRRRHNENQIAQAETPRHKLWAACAWLVSEAWKAGLLDETLDWVLTKVHEIREPQKEVNHDDYDYAA